MAENTKIQEELFEEGKLHGLFSVISNKTVRKNEKFYKKFKGHKDVPGSMVKTNRGYFIDGYNVDQRSVTLWFNLVKNSKKEIDMSELSKDFITTIGKILKDETFQKLIGEHFPEFEVVVKAAIGINDSDTLTKIVVTLIPGLDIAGHKSIRYILDDPITKVVAIKNTTENNYE